MPNIGRPSKACTTCKRRKVKCSETYPRCHGCTRLDLSCSWIEVSIFRRQEHWAERSVAHRVERTNLLRGDTQIGRETLSLANPVPNQTIIDMETYALHNFYVEYAYTAGTCPFLYLVAPLFEEASSPICLHSSVRAASLATTAKQLKRPEMMRRAQQHYWRALKSLAKTLGQPEKAKHDGILLALCLLYLYETMTCAGTPKEQKQLYRMHSEGRLAIVRLRGPQQLQSKIGRNIFILFYHQQLVWSFDDCGAILQEYPTWANEWYPDTPIAKLEILMHEISCFVSEVKRSMNTSKPTVVQNLLERGKLMEGVLSTAVETLLISWPDHRDILGRLTGSDRPIDLPTELTSNLDDLPNNLEIYANITRALTANLLRGIYIRLLQALKLASEYLILQSDSQSGLKELSIRINQTMQQKAEEIYGDISLAIGNCPGHHRDNHETPYRYGKDALDRVHRSEMDEYCREIPHEKYRIHGRALRAWIMLFPLESALNVEPISKALREDLIRSFNYTKGIMGLDFGF